MAEIKNTLANVSLSLEQAAEAVKKLESIAGPTDIVNSVHSLRNEMNGKLEGIEKLLREVIELEKQQLQRADALLEESKKQSALAEKQLLVSKITAIQSVMSGNAARLPNPSSKGTDYFSKANNVFLWY